MVRLHARTFPHMKHILRSMSTMWASDLYLEDLDLHRKQEMFFILFSQETCFCHNAQEMTHQVRK